MPGCLLFVGDIHLGRRPVRLNDALAGLGLDARRLGPSRAWELAVDEAVTSGARAVVLAGDVVEGEKDRLEGYGHLERGVLRLQEHGIHVFGVAGNHDALVLPRLADRLTDAFTLLGRGGIWELVQVPGDGPPIDLLGWSFPTPAYPDDPTMLDSLQPALDTARPEARLLCVTHGDLDVGPSRYAPLSLARLQASPAHAWFLGHIHQPSALAGERPIGYLGSLTGMDPGEDGCRGPWAVEVVGGSVRATQVPLAPIRYENVDVSLEDATGTETLDGVHGHIQRTLREHVLADPTFQDPRLQVIVARVRLTGRLAERAGVRQLAREPVPHRATIDLDGKPCVLGKITDATLPALDLAELARQTTPVGLVARRILDLQSGGAEDLLEQARRRIEPLSAGRWAPPTESRPIDAREALLTAARRALGEMLSQQGHGGAA